MAATFDCERKELGKPSKQISQIHRGAFTYVHLRTGFSVRKYPSICQAKICQGTSKANCSATLSCAQTRERFCLFLQSATESCPFLASLPLTANLNQTGQQPSKVLNSSQKNLTAVTEVLRHFVLGGARYRLADGEECGNNQNQTFMNIFHRHI